MSEQEIEYIKSSFYEEPRPLTTVVGIKCTDGIIIASDSQATFETLKNLEVSKIYQINENTGLAAAGDARHITTLVDTLRSFLGQTKFENESDLINKIDECLTYLHRKYNVDRSFRLGFRQIMYFFNPQALLGVRLADGSFGLYNLTFEPWIESIDNYKTIGSGYLLANLILNQQSRFLKNTSTKLSNFELFYNLWIASYTINEVKAIEPYTGGNTKVAFINNLGYHILEDDQVSDYYKYTIEKIANLFGTLANNKELENVLKNWYPKS